MPRPKKLRTGLLAALAVSIAASGGLVAVGIGAPGGAKPPDLTPLLPTDSSTHVARFMDTVQQPGHTLVRFDTVLMNGADAGRLDLYRTGAGQPTEQKVWQIGEALDTPSPDAAPADTSNSTALADFYKFFYFDAAGHHHFHFPHAAQYQLTTLAGAVIGDSPKNNVGFCLFDSYSQDPVFAADPCHPGESTYTGPIRMGISPDSGDLYGAGLTDQWVDVTAVMPGDYLIRATANPDHVIQESDYSDNVRSFPITVAGAAPSDATASTPSGAPVDVSLGARVFGSDILNRIAPGGTNCGGENADLYNPASACFNTTPASTTRVTFAVTDAAGGTAAITSQSGLGATLRFTPAAGFSGTATVHYTATDSRGLTSPAATATIQVAPASGLSSSPPRTAGARRKAKVTLAPRLSVVHRKGRYYVAVKGHVTRSLATRNIVVQRRVGKKRIVTMARITVGKKGNYAALVRMPSRTVTVRTFIGSTKTTKAAVSRFRTLAR
jgi:hypothetical protein